MKLAIIKQKVIHLHVQRVPPQSRVSSRDVFHKQMITEQKQAHFCTLGQLNI